MYRCFVRKRVPVLSRGLWCGVPSIVDRVRGRFITTAETIIGVDRFNVECEEFSFLTRNDEG